MFYKLGAFFLNWGQMCYWNIKMFFNQMFHQISDDSFLLEKSMGVMITKQNF